MSDIAGQLKTAWNPILEAIENGSRDESALTSLALKLTEFSELTQCNELDELARGSRQLARMVEAAATWKIRNPDDVGLVDEMMDFVESHLHELELGIGSGLPNPGIDEMIKLSNEAWSDYLSMSESLSVSDSDWDEDFAPESVDSIADEVLPSGNDIEMLLAALSGASEVRHDKPSIEVDVASEARTTTPEQKPKVSGSVNASAKETHLKAKRDPQKQPAATNYNASRDSVAREELRADREMLDAYLDDSLRCVDSMETAALALDATPGDKDSIRAFCRELHTLKGASATVGLSGLASHLHNLESSLEEIFAEDAKANPEKLFESIDFVRKEMASLKPDNANIVAKESRREKGRKLKPVAELASGAQPSQPAKITNVPNARVVSPVAKQSKRRKKQSFSNENSSIRIRAAQLDRLMDMLAELVVLRNRRDNNASEFDLLYGELSRCATRLTIVEEQSGTVANASIIGEVSKDIDAVARGFRSLQKPVANDNAAISRFIRDFRQELMHLRRVPISGLFGRLQRAARDAAKTENKKVQVKVVGENTGLEQEIQERLYESLLHVVRNSVSHGILSPETRAIAGKEEAGTITLEASGSAQLLVIEVRDDGNGVNYEAVRNRGIEKGLIAPTQQVSNEELANLIFQPGFSTKEAASEVSGRGVGMDVVATTLEEMRGRIEVESVSGKGTTIRLVIPRRTGIEHVMVFRSHDQLYALPMQSIVAAKQSRKGFESLWKLNFSRNANQRSSNVLIFKRSRLSGNGEDSHIAIAVEELLGPEEVVVRRLPPMLQNHPLFSGITLSGSGEKVLLLESENVADYCVRESEIDAVKASDDVADNRLRALVVDDSITARKHISKLLKGNGFAVVEAGDGLEAIESLHRSNFDFVVTDLDMPRLGGLELLADIRNGKYCMAPVVVVSSRDDDGFRRQALEYGASDFVNKPVSKQQFQQLLKQLGLVEKNLGKEDV
jgi:chemotaxis protein histidine kinase CheA/CheY-like chemotaxis protein